MNYDSNKRMRNDLKEVIVAEKRISKYASSYQTKIRI
jgi:hypothetical protein